MHVVATVHGVDMPPNKRPEPHVTVEEEQLVTVG